MVVLLLLLTIFDLQLFDLTFQSSNFLAAHSELVATGGERLDPYLIGSTILGLGQKLLFRGQAETLFELNLIYNEEFTEPQTLPLVFIACLPQFSNQSRIGVPIYFWFVLYFSSSASIIKSVQRLVEIALCWRDARYHGCPRITAEGILQDPGQFRISVRDEVAFFAFVTERGNDIAQDQETFVDIDSLLQRGAHSSSLLGSLTARQINEMELGDHELS